MKRKNILSLTTALGIILIVALESTAGWLARHNLDAEKIEIAALAGVILLVINVVFHFSSIQAEEILAHVADFEKRYMQSHEGRIRLLTSTETYTELRVDVMLAKDRIYTCYFGDYPPGETPQEKKDYHNSILQAAKKRPNIRIRRIVLFTPRNLPWIKKLISECHNLPNKSLAVYCLAPGTSLPLSIQLVDQSKLIIVNPASRPPGQRRDISILDREAVQLMDGYYERIWQASEVVVLRGEIQEESVQKIIAMNSVRASSTNYIEEE